jgi:hypothetical protein
VTAAPTSIGEFSKVAPYLTNPLVLIGFVLLLFFGIHRALIKSGVLTPVSKTASSKIVRLLLHYGFIVALLLTLFGFGLTAWNEYLKTKGTQPKTGNASASGVGSVANTGNGNTINQPSPPANPPKKE